MIIHMYNESVIQLALFVHYHSRLVSYELLYENMSNRRERMKVIISSQYLYFFQDSPPDPSTVNAKISLDELAECRSAIGKTSEYCS